MTDLVKLIVDNGITVVVLGYFMFMNYKFNEKMIVTMQKICDTLESIADYRKEEE